MKTLKKLTCIFTIALAGLVFASSCSKEMQKGEKKGKKTAVATKAKSLSAEEGKNILSAVRNGQYVELNWQLNVPISEIKRLNIMRSPTGVKQRVKVAELYPDIITYKDRLPDGNAQWYWLVIVTSSGKNFEIGPAKVGRDSTGSSQYGKADEDKYKVVITRTDDLATLMWDFPESECKAIAIARHTRPVAKPFQQDKARLLTTLACKAQSTDALPDPNEDYWYWFKITTESGAIIYKGPIKAEYKN